LFWGRYTHRVASSNIRWFVLTEGKVTSQLADSASHNETKTHDLVAPRGSTFFFGRFLLHLPPQRFFRSVRIRNFGFRPIATCHQLPLLLSVARLFSGSFRRSNKNRSGTNKASDLWRCPKFWGFFFFEDRWWVVEKQKRGVWGGSKPKKGYAAEIQLPFFSPPLLTSAPHETPFFSNPKSFAPLAVPPTCCLFQFLCVL